MYAELHNAEVRFVKAEPTETPGSGALDRLLPWAKQMGRIEMMQERDAGVELFPTEFNVKELPPPAEFSELLISVPTGRGFSGYQQNEEAKADQDEGSSIVFHVPPFKLPRLELDVRTQFSERRTYSKVLGLWCTPDELLIDSTTERPSMALAELALLTKFSISDPQIAKLSELTGIKTLLCNEGNGTPAIWNNFIISLVGLEQVVLKLNNRELIFVRWDFNIPHTTENIYIRLDKTYSAEHPGVVIEIYDDRGVLTSRGVLTRNGGYDYEEK